MNARNLRLLFALAFGLLAVTGTLALLKLLGSEPLLVRAAPGTLYVAPGGACGGANPCYASVQRAVDVAQPDDEIRVAEGVYTDTSVRPRNDVATIGVVTQVVYISKTVTIRGGYTTTNWTVPHPLTQPTTLDAKGQGRVLYIAGDISPTIENLRITGGNAAGQLGTWMYLDPRQCCDVGGGVYVISATAIISNNYIFNNMVPNNNGTDGGGLYLTHSGALLNGNTVVSNTAPYYGGGLHLDQSIATLNRNAILSNTAGYGGGLDVEGGVVTLSENSIDFNAATGFVPDWDGRGGGLFGEEVSLRLSGNSISANRARFGGGVMLYGSPAAILDGNVIVSNTSRDSGGGLDVWNSALTLENNTIAANTAVSDCGGLRLVPGLYTPLVTLSGNIVTSNTARHGGGLCLYGARSGDHVQAFSLNRDIITGNGAECGGGMLINGNSELTNTVITDNQARASGSGLYINDRSAVSLVHATLARNSGGDGSGVYVGGICGGGWPGRYSTIVMTNTILVSHTIGIRVASGGVVANGILWFGTPVTVSLAATATMVVRNQYQDDPAFALDGYHLTPGSAAIDRGVNAGVTSDIDGEPRPMGHGYDLGADEFPVALWVTKTATPDPVQAGAQLTYTINVANTGDVTLTATVTDLLPVHITPGTTPSGSLILPGGTLTWSPVIIALGDTWMQQVVVTMEHGYTGTLTNVAQVTTVEGATGIYTVTVNQPKVYLPLVVSW